jgi:endo-1,4-beta-xylanase
MKTYLIALSMLSTFYASCAKNFVEDNDARSASASGSQVGPADTAKVLKDANPNVKIGAAVSITLLNQAGAYRDLALRQYNSFTAENAMKMTALEPQDGVFNFSDHTIEEAALNNGKKRIHGHTLVWHNSLPAWVKNWETAALSTGTTRAAKYDTIMRRHIRTVIFNYSNPASIYKDDSGAPLLKSWDVVNEAFDDNGNYRSIVNMVNGEDKGSIWYRNIGRSYVQKAFTYAREAAEARGDSGLKLFYNDYGHEYSAKKLDSIYNMVMALKQVTVNGKAIIDGIGMQFHININTSNTNIKNALIKMASTGLLIHISELDVGLNKPGLPFSAAALNLQQQKYQDVAMLYRKYVVASQRWGITTWNIGDKDSWLTYSAGVQVDAATLYDLNYSPKPDYYFFYKGLNLDIPASY